MSCWRKSSHSFSNGNCVEVGSTWRTPSRSTYNGNCVEAGSCCCGVAVRDSKLAESPVLTFPSGAWREFTAEVKAVRLPGDVGAVR